MELGWQKRRKCCKNMRGDERKSMGRGENKI
jgi:hypothetical protein